MSLPEPNNSAPALTQPAEAVVAFDSPPSPPPDPLAALSPAQWGMASFLLSEAAFFSTLITVYLTFRGADTTGPTPAVLALPLVIGTTVCLLASSVTVHLAVTSLRTGSQVSFRRWWSATILLGILFLLGTAWEWRVLIVEHNLTIGRNLFGSTYFTLVGFHALHVTIGVLAMLTLLSLSLNAEVPEAGADLVSWYWHFVDVVWVVVFSVVYLY